MYRFLTVVFASLLAGCGASTNSPSYYDQQSSTSLWLLQGTTQSATELLHAEAELASRGETRSGPYYLGRRSAAAVGTSRYSRTAVNSDRNCGDFNSSLAAQTFFLAAGGPVSDPHGLDRDGDGFACEWGTRVQQLARSGRAVTRTPRRPRYTPTCYTGPRGGTYTITASGNRNYGGC